MINKLLIANRGEIAVRIARACAEMGIRSLEGGVRSVAIYTDADRHGLHVKKADEAYSVGPDPVAGYLNAHRIVNLAVETGCTAIHPGYGFLSENPQLADICAKRRIRFIGPSAKVMRRMGDKTEARKAMVAAGVPVTPGSNENLADLADLAMFWLTAVYGEIFAKCSSGMKEADNVRQKLVHLAEDLIKKHADSGDVARKSTLVCWNIEKRLVEDLYALVGNRQDFSHLVCTPRFAMRFGRSAEVLRLIRKNRGFFKNREHYLLTGTYYSLAGESLFCIENRDYDKALAVLPDEGHDEFVDYGVRRVKFAYGLYCLEQGEIWPGRYLESAMALFDIAPEYEKVLIDNAMAVVGLNEQRCYEEALTEIHKRRPSRGIKDALSLIMSRRAIDMYNQEQINDKTLDTILRKALALNPKNEHAIGNLNDTQVELQRTELAKALKRHKMNKACKIAAETENREVRDEFFEFFEYTVKSLDKMEMEDKEKTFLLKDFYGWCARVDESHPVLYDIGHMLDQLELR